MTRHIIDRTEARPAPKATLRFVQIDRQTRPHVASKVLQKRPKPVGSGRLRAFMRIERGQLA